jgi:protein farnesyltransferase/geranylgeranyltransferase type-1 subunit alpha
MGSYSESAEWSDIEPIPLNEGTLQPLAAIALSDDYLEATAYLRAIMAKNELSTRALDLTADIIAMNPSHYTVW